MGSSQNSFILNGALLKDSRLKKGGMSQRDVSDEIDLSKSTIAKAETGKPVSAKTLLELQRFFELEEELVLSIDDEDDLKVDLAGDANAQVALAKLRLVNDELSAISDPEELFLIQKLLMQMLDENRVKMSGGTVGSFHWNIHLSERGVELISKYFPVNEDGEYIVTRKTIASAQVKKESEELKSCVGATKQDSVPQVNGDRELVVNEDTVTRLSDSARMVARDKQMANSGSSTNVTSRSSSGIPVEIATSPVSRLGTGMQVRWRGLELPSSVEPDRESLTPTYGKFSAEPFEHGFGASVGNSLRRVLLSSLMGSAVTQIKIQGAQHEFSTIPGVLEDVTEIVLNVKGLVVRNHSESTRVITVESNNVGTITGTDIRTDADIEIINKNHVVATLTENVPFMMEMVIENGRGYVPSSGNADHEIGIIPIDAVFSPITRVRYKIEEARVGEKINYDRLLVEIWTDGSMTPEIALVEAAKILRKHLNPFVDYCELGPSMIDRDGSTEAQLEAKLSMRLSDLRLSIRASNCLESENIHSVRDLVRRTEDQLLEVRNFGDTSLNEVRKKLSQYGLHLGMRVQKSNLS